MNAQLVNETSTCAMFSNMLGSADCNITDHTHCLIKTGTSQ